MPCDLDGRCPFPGEPGTIGALWPENMDLAEAWRIYKTLGHWALEGLPPLDGDPYENVMLFYTLEIENRILRREYTFDDHAVRMIWDTED